MGSGNGYPEMVAKARAHGEGIFKLFPTDRCVRDYVEKLMTLNFNKLATFKFVMTLFDGLTIAISN
jgi:hypothetical protein